MRSKNLKMLLVSLGFVLFANAQAESLHQAVYANNIESVKSLLVNGADINQLGLSVYSSESPLHTAVSNGHMDIARLLLEQGANVDIRGKNDFTPLHHATYNGNLDMVKLLFNAGADITARNYRGHTPLSCARDGGRVEVIQFIEGKLQPVSN